MKYVKNGIQTEDGSGVMGHRDIELASYSEELYNSEGNFRVIKCKRYDDQSDEFDMVAFATKLIMGE